MLLDFNLNIADGYRSRSQIARRLTEHWCSREMFCCACASDRLQPSIANTAAIDFTCPNCTATYQLKSRKHHTEKKLVDAAYADMVSAIRNQRAPHLLLLNYSPTSVENLTLVPRQFFVESVVERRRPLRPTAQRAGWVGCNILWSRIPPDGRIAVVESGSVVKRELVRDSFRRMQGLADIKPESRGWTLDVLAVVRELNRPMFTLADVYRFETRLATAHPDNRHVRDKIRQQLQVLRDLGFVRFLGNGRYEIP